MFYEHFILTILWSLLRQKWFKNSNHATKIFRSQLALHSLSDLLINLYPLSLHNYATHHTTYHITTQPTSLIHTQNHAHTSHTTHPTHNHAAHTTPHTAHAHKTQLSRGPSVCHHSISPRISCGH